MIEVTFAIVGGVNLGLERSWQVVEDLIKKYPKATWKRIINRKKQKAKYIIEIEE